MLMPFDRLTRLRANPTTFTGIEFVHIVEPCDQTVLRIYFLTDITELTTSLVTGVGALRHEDIVIHDASGDTTVPNVELDASVPLAFGFDAASGRRFLDVAVREPGDFRNYRLRIDDPLVTGTPTTPPFSRVDPFFNDVVFSFKAGCEDNLDCKEPALECPVEARVDFPVDYLARDFTSLRNALLDFVAQRHPHWTFPIEADVGSVLLEIFAALGDEFSYIQDRYAREAFLETATERRSLRKKARLLDYEIHDGLNASTDLELTVETGTGLLSIQPGARVWALAERGPPIAFEVGRGLKDPRRDDLTGYAVSSEWNAGTLQPHVFDDSRQCLEIGATEVFVVGTVPNASALTAGVERGDRLMLLRTEPDDPALPRRRHLVHITEISVLADPLLTTVDKSVTRIRWAEQDALPFQIDQAFLQLSLNVVPATAGETRTVRFLSGREPNTTSALPVAVEREGPLPAQLDPNEPEPRPTVFLFSLPDTDAGGLGYLLPAAEAGTLASFTRDIRTAEPEVRLREVESREWTWFRSLIEAGADREAFTIEDGTWRRIIAFVREGQEIVHQDYASGAGYTVRFGDGVFGRIPDRATEFEAEYRLGPGARANVPADAVTALTLPGQPLPPVEHRMPPEVLRVTNPLPVTNGADPESADDIRLNTPEAYRAQVFFAVTPDDYGEQAKRLDFVQRAHGTLRWTGSYTTAFVAADPFGAFTLTDEQRSGLEELMDCVRQAGRDVVVKDPNFIDLDLQITICVEPFAYPGQVRQQVFEALLGRGGARPIKGFFHPDNFTFGTPLRRSALEAVIHDVPGVRAVLDMRIRARGRRNLERFDDLAFVVCPNEVIRLENDPTRPERGSLRVLTEGGA